MVAPPVHTGDIVAGKYAVIRPLGKGGMGFVVAARHTTLDQVVAIKFLVKGFGEKGESAARFLREARAAAKIESDYVCRVFDTGVLDSGVPFFVMELLDGIDLEQEIDQRGRLPADEAVDFTMQALDAIATAHKLGIIHRDLKPANLFLTERADGTRRLKVFDFGISKTDEIDVEIEDTQGIIGTPAYMSPEQARNAKKTDHRTDLFSLGAILFEALAGRPPHLGESVGEILDSVMNKKPRDLGELRPDLPPELVAAVMRALEPDREARFANAQEFARALSPFASSAFANLVQSIPAPNPSQQRIAAADSVRPSSSRPSASTRETVAGWTQGGLRELVSRRRGYVVFGVAALLVSAVVWLALARNHARANASDEGSSATSPIASLGRPDVDGVALASAASPIPSGPSARASGSSVPAPSLLQAPAQVSSPVTYAQPEKASAPTKAPQKNTPAPSHDLPPGKNKGNPLLDNRE